MKSRYLALVPILLLLLLLVPLAYKHNEQRIGRDSNTADSRSTPDRASTPPPGYTTAPASADGIGKFFMGREIAKVMGHPGIGWLERDTREKEEAPSKAITLLGLTPDTVIADIGAGSGYYTFRLADLVPQGKVIAVDIQQEMLDHLTKEAGRRNTTNVTPHLGTIEDIQLPADTLDAVLMVDSYHEFSHPVEMLQSIRKALKPGGIIYLLEYRAEDPRVPIKPLHKMTEEQAVREFKALGFRHVGNKRALPWQHLLLFEKP